MSEREPKTVVVALSGGIDSLASALLLKEKGYSVKGVHFRIIHSESELTRAVNAANWAGIELTVLDLRENFRASVINYFKTELRAGRTPVPCSFCNPNFKWKHLLDFADSVGADNYAMGHYVGVQNIDGEFLISKGLDSSKDQSYYLWDLSQELLSRAIFPLSQMTKSEAREYLSNQGFLPQDHPKESMSLCFLPKGQSYIEYLKNEFSCATGDILDTQGTLVGTHQGAVLYTIGQKRGLEIFERYSHENWAVKSVNVLDNQIVVSSNPECLYGDRIVLDRWRLSDRAFRKGSDLKVVVRGIGRNPQGGCQLERLCDGGLEVKLLDDMAWAVASGQAVVIYQGDLVLGGGYVR